MATEKDCKMLLATRIRVFSLVYGIVWLIDAVFKWLPGFRLDLANFLNNAMQGQPGSIMPWFMVWIRFTNVDPVVFAVIIAILESMVAISLLFGVARKPMYIIGALVSLGVWSVGEGFGGPYGYGATDIGAAIMYVFIFAGLWLLEESTAPYARWSLDMVIAKKWPFWRYFGVWRPIIVAK